MHEIYIIAFILSVMIIPQIFLLRVVRVLDLKLLQFLTFFNFIANNIYIYISSIIMFTLNLILPF